MGSRGLRFEGGGKGYNQALGALRQGAEVFFATAVGEDAYGCQAAHVFREDGLNWFSCLKCPGAATAFAAVASDVTGKNIVLVEQGACSQVTPRQIDALEPEIRRCGILLLQNEMPSAAVYRCLELGQAHGLLTILNPAPAGGLDRAVLAMADVITPNLGEARELAGMPEAQADQLCQALREMGCANVIITLGGEGAFVAPCGERGYIQPAFPVECVDSTGAGDNFNGVLAACLARGMDLTEAARFAAASSALSVTRQGVLQAIPTRTQVEEFLRRVG